MFFGAGNVVFPLGLGRVAGNMNFYAILGLLLSAVLIPFTGVIAMFLFEGDYQSFFVRIGKIPGFFVTAFLMCIIGPFVAIPRCITLSYSTLKLYFPSTSLVFFSITACVIIFILTRKRRKILDILGYVLAPILVLSLVILVVKGLIIHPESIQTDHTRLGIFYYGLKEGYFTMDLFAAFFFSVVILIGLKKSLGASFDTKTVQGKKELLSITLKSTLVGAGLIGLIYSGFSFVSSFYGSELYGVQKDTILSVLADKILGPIGGIIANTCVMLACLTTAMTLVAVFSEFIQNQIFKKRFNYISCLLITLIFSFVFSNLGFMGILKMSAPILHICYPVLILLTVLNVGHRMFGFKFVKIPVLVAFIISFIVYFI
ncbi:branched-chain amino acid transport system II carrier protein [Candidatus Babeliales bacterium]|nr:branched-chain amino acid transport system II carrier protein [Candidatus Babeliales bacterium]